MLTMSLFASGPTGNAAPHVSATRNDAADQEAQSVVAGRGPETDHDDLDPETENVVDRVTGKKRILRTNQNAGIQGLQTEVKIIPRGKTELILFDC